MAETSEINGGTVVWKAKFDVPKSEQAKFDVMTKRSAQMDRFYQSFDRGGGAMAATIGGLGALTAGQGMQSVLGAFSAIGGAIMDLLTLPLLPMIMPFMKDMIGVVKNLADARNEPGGIWGGIGKAMGGLWDSMREKLKSAWNWVMGQIGPQLQDIFHKCAAILIGVFGGWLLYKALPSFLAATGGGGMGGGMAGGLGRGFGSSLAMGLGATSIGTAIGFGLGGGQGAVLGGVLSGAVSGAVVGSRFGGWGIAGGALLGGLFGWFEGSQLGGG